MQNTQDVSPDTLFPPHSCGLFLRHNEHRDLYQTLEQFLLENDKLDHFADADALQRALDTDEYWELHWYPRTPVGFFVLAAPTLGELLVLAHQVAREDANHNP